MTQWNLLTMTFDMQYFIDGSSNVVINKNQTLLALNVNNSNEDKKIEVFSMETGMRVSKYG